MQPDTAKTASEFIRSQIPSDGLFAGMDWRITPEPFSLGPDLSKQIASLGRILLSFYRAVNLLYRQSLSGKQPAWIAGWLDQGKPPHLLEYQRAAAFKGDVPRVIRPDLLLTETGLSVTELDSVPGGIGLTGWLNETYSRLPGSKPVLGGERGMIDGFASIFGDAANIHLVVSEESSTYRPEMEWIASKIDQQRFKVRAADFGDYLEGDAVYRFFELFDLKQVPAAEKILQLALEQKVSLTPPPKPIFEEKMLFALLWNRNLSGFWRQQLGESFFERLLKLTPYTWLIDPTPLPAQGAYPEINLTDWQQLKLLSQKDRDLILKISGFSESAWGARGVYLGSDLSIPDWSTAVDTAINSFGQNPYVLQRYQKPRTVPSQYFDFATQTLVDMPARVRLCPYYFVAGEGDSARPTLGGVLATICPADKKIIHGMTDAALAPCCE